MMRIDARLPVRFGPLQARMADEAVLMDNDTPAANPVGRFTTGPGGHAPGCRCCTLRSSASLALATLFRERATGGGVAFRGVLAVVGPEGEAAVRAALESDLLVAGRYRLAC